MSANSAATQESNTPVNPRHRVILATLVGTTIEFYDFYVYATAAVLVFPHLFFVNNDPTIALLQSFAAFGVAFVARPIGSIIFGHYGDKIGRKATLIGALLTMGIATFIIGLLPVVPLDASGQPLNSPLAFWAPALLVLMRFCQGLGLGGEWSGAALVATENAPEGKRALYGTFPQLGAPIGFILANSIFLGLAFLLPSDDPSQPSPAFLDWGWRVPFLLSAVMVIVGLWVRLRLVETPAFQRTLDRGEVEKLPLLATLRRHWWALILGTFIMLATYVLFYLMTAFSLTYGRAPIEPTTEGAVPGLGYSYNNFILMMIVGCVFFGIFTLISGPLADRFGRRTMLLWVSAGIVVFGFVFMPLLWGGFAGVMAFLIIGFTLMGLTFGPMAAILPELFPTNVRYTGSAIAYNVSSILGAGLAPSVALLLWQSQSDGNPWLVGIYLSAASLLTVLALALSKETKDIDILK